MQFPIGKRKFHQYHGLVCSSEKQSLHASHKSRVTSTVQRRFLFINKSLHLFQSNNRILELLQIGLIDHWDTWFRPMPPQCSGKPQSGNKKKKTTTPLSLKNLTGAFLVLLIGLSLSILSFLIEKINSVYKCRRSRIGN
jgi:hypothetical protein